MVEAWRAHAERFELHTSAGDHFDFVEHDHNRALLARLVAAAQPR